MFMDTDNKEVIGDNQDKEKLEAFSTCKYLDTEFGKGCKYKDTKDKCIWENCILDGAELPKPNLLWTFNCLICGTTTSVTTSNMKIMFCKECLERIKTAEHLPYTCRYCGRVCHGRSKWLFSQLCDQCIEKLNPNK